MSVVADSRLRTVIVGLSATLVAFGPRLVHADEDPSDCGLTNYDPFSGVLIKSCPQTGLNNHDVAIDGDYMYIVDGWGPPSDEQELLIYDIDDVEAPTVANQMTTTFTDTAGEIGALSVTAGNGIVFVAYDCASSSGCDGDLMIQAWNSCNSWSQSQLVGGSGVPDPATIEGMHTVFYDPDNEVLYGATATDAVEFPAWSTGVSSCPIGSSVQASTAHGQGSVNFHEVAAGYGRIAAGATTHVQLYDDAGGFLASASDRSNYHSAVPFSSTGILATQEMNGGRLLGYSHSGGTSLVPKGAHKLPSTKSCSYHELAYDGSQMYASAYQAGLRAWRWVPDEGDFILAAYFDTSNSDAQACTQSITDWYGASGVAVGPADGSARRIVAVSNIATPLTGDNRTFLLSVYNPDITTCSNINCTLYSVAPSPYGIYTDVLVAHGSDDGSTYAGELLRYPGSASGPGSPVALNQANLTAGHDYGYDVAVGDFNDDGLSDIAVGAPGQQTGAGDRAGVVYIYRRQSNGTFALAQTLDQSSLGSNADDERFGAALAAGDFDGDGDDDLAVGAPAASEGSAEAGAVFLFRNSSGSLTGWTTITDSNGLGGDRYGHALAVGNFNGTGPDDLAIGSPQGRANVFTDHYGFVDVYRGKTGSAPVFDVRKSQTGLDANEVEDRFGFSLAAGDFNDDRRDDLAVGASGEHIGTISAGAVYVFLGSTTSTLVASHTIDQANLDANEEEDAFSRRLTVGDFNDDGYDDLAVAAPGEMPGSNPRAGRVYIFKGSSTVLRNQTMVDQGGLQTHDDLDGFGERLAGGDWNGDGRSDLLVVAPGLLHDRTSNPLFLYQGTANGPTDWQTL